jgi:hypothetical protein
VKTDNLPKEAVYLSLKRDRDLNASEISILFLGVKLVPALLKDYIQFLA